MIPRTVSIGRHCKSLMLHCTTQCHDVSIYSGTSHNGQRHRSQCVRYSEVPLYYYTPSCLKTKNGFQHCSWPCWHPLIFVCSHDRVCRVLVGFCSQWLSNRNEENPVCCCLALLYTRNNEHTSRIVCYLVWR